MEKEPRGWGQMKLHLKMEFFPRGGRGNPQRRMNKGKTGVEMFGKRPI
jgi:hypothetical protein